MNTPQPEEWKRQVEEHQAKSLPLLDFRDAPPGWVKDPIRDWTHEPDAPGSKHRRRPLDAAWSLYKSEHAPPGMWCGFSRDPIDMQNCRIRVGVSACGARWELSPDIEIPFSGYLAKAREWAWAWHDSRHALTTELLKRAELLASIGKEIKFHLILCWHDEWVAEASAWAKDPTLPIPKAFVSLGRRSS